MRVHTVWAAFFFHFVLSLANVHDGGRLSRSHVCVLLVSMVVALLQNENKTAHTSQVYVALGEDANWCDATFDPNDPSVRRRATLNDGGLFDSYFALAEKLAVDLRPVRLQRTSFYFGERVV